MVLSAIFLTYVTLCKSQAKMISVSIPLSPAHFFAVKSFKILSSRNFKYTNSLLLSIVTLIINIPMRSMVSKLLTKYAEQDSKPNHSDNTLCSNPQTYFSYKNTNLLYCGCVLLKICKWYLYTLNRRVLYSRY